MMMNEKTAIASIQEGKLEGMELLVKRYQDKAFHAAMMIVRDHQLAEDIVQQCFLKAYDNIQSFKSELPFGPWFFRIVVNHAINAARRQARLRPLEEGDEEDESVVQRWIVDPQPMPEEQLAHVQTARELREALAKLSPEHRAVLVMRYYLMMGDKEIAAQQKRPLSTVKWWLRSAKRKMRSMLEQDEISNSSKEGEPHGKRTPDKAI